MQVGEVVILPSGDSDVFRIIYKADMKWNVTVNLLNEKGRTKMSKEIKDTDSFLLPINLSQEESGTYTVEIRTAAYDLKETFTYQKYEDLAAKAIKFNYDVARKSLNIEVESDLNQAITVFIHNEVNMVLIEDKIVAAKKGFYRVYSLNGAPARTLMVSVFMSGIMIKEERYGF